ncbi:MAG: class I SAM-dependent methyltransferase [Anaerolineae bacterium]|nr:class I SAM-dependent methyltransferase [Anaerolineae bacterium]
MIDRLVEKRDGEQVYPLLADATRLPFADAAFDAVIAVHIFHLIPAYAEAFAEAARVLKPGGVLAHGWNTRHTEDVLNQVWNTATQSEGVTPGIPFEERQKMLPAHGWRLQSEDHHPYRLERAPARFLDDLRGRVYSHCWTMSDAALQSGLTAVQAYMAEHGIDPHQPRVIDTEFRVQTFQPPG